MVPTKIYDLSQPVFDDCPQYCDDPPRPARVHRIYALAIDGVEKEIVEISSHTGTHCDAPSHFLAGGKAIDEVPLETYVGPATIVDLRRKKAPASPIERADLTSASIEPGDIVLLNTGWGHERASTPSFLTQWPYLSGDGADYLVACGAKGVGIDAVSLGGYGDPALGRPPHLSLLGAGKFIIEDLFIPDDVMDGRKRLFVGAPVKLRGCSGGWARAMLWDVA